MDLIHSRMQHVQSTIDRFILIICIDKCITTIKIIHLELINSGWHSMFRA
jgi:hypothetical protein